MFHKGICSDNGSLIESRNVLKYWEKFETTLVVKIRCLRFITFVVSDSDWTAAVKRVLRALARERYAFIKHVTTRDRSKGVVWKINSFFQSVAINTVRTSEGTAVHNSSRKNQKKTFEITVQCPPSSCTCNSAAVFVVLWSHANNIISDQTTL